MSPRLPKGGIAQLVERQLCKLDVRGSSPRASTMPVNRAGKENRERIKQPTLFDGRLKQSLKSQKSVELIRMGL